MKEQRLITVKAHKKAKEYGKNRNVKKETHTQTIKKKKKKKPLLAFIKQPQTNLVCKKKNFG